MKNETIFFATFETDSKKFDRRSYFKSKKTLREFHYWLEGKREEIEKGFHGKCIIINIQFIEL